VAIQIYDAQGLDGYNPMYYFRSVQYSFGATGYTWPYPQDADRYVQKVWDPAVGGGEWVSWPSYGFADVSGTQYPHGQGQYAGTTGYRTVGIFHERNVT